MFRAHLEQQDVTKMERFAHLHKHKGKRKCYPCSTPSTAIDLVNQLSSELCWGWPAAAPHSADCMPHLQPHLVSSRQKEPTATPPSEVRGLEEILTNTGYKATRSSLLTRAAWVLSKPQCTQTACCLALLWEFGMVAAPLHGVCFSLCTEPVTSSTPPLLNFNDL